MKQELQNKLFDTYPNLFKQKDGDPSKTCMIYGICIGDGWFNLLYTLCSNIDSHLDSNKEVPKVEFTQIKEKFGGLRAYYSGGDKYISGLVSFAESMSYKICDVCGNAGKSSNTLNRGWLATRCGKHKDYHWNPALGNDNNRKDICIDFDGVIHSYVSGFEKMDKIVDLPVDGAFDFIKMLLDNKYKVYIFSVRNSDQGGYRAMKDWFINNGMSEETLDQLEFPIYKPSAHLYIDDRAYEFRGQFPSINEIKGFRTWTQEKESSSEQLEE